MASNCGCPACPLLPSLLVTRRQRSYYRLPAINATGRPALGRRRSRLRSLKAAFFTLAALDDSRLAVSVEPARRFGQPRLPNPQSGNVLFLNTELLNLNTSDCRYPWPTLRRRYGPVLATLASSLTDFHVCLLYTSPSPRDLSTSRMPSSA